MKIRVLEVLCEPISSGGQESFLMSVYNNIDMTDLSIDVFTPYFCDNELYKTQIHNRGGKLYCRGLKFNPGGLKFNIISPIRTVLRKNNYDIVHIHTGSVFSMACACIAAKMEGVKRIIVHSHSSAERHTPKRDIIKKLCTPFINKYATEYLACSEEAGEWKFSKSICDSRLQIVKNGIDTDVFSFDEEKRKQIRKSLGIGEESIVLGHVGRFSEEKNQSFLIDIMNRLSSDARYKLILIGEGETKKQINKMVEINGLDEQVIFVGNTDRVADYMCAMDIFLLPSKFEGLGIVAIEAQSTGLDIIASDNVPKDIDITNNAKFLSLDEPELWVKCIVDYKKKKRSDNSDIVRKNGFYIKDTASVIRDIYKKKKNVLVFGMTPIPGGVESFIMNYYREIDKSKIHFDFLCNTKEDIAYTKELEGSGSKIYHITPKSEGYIKYKKEIALFFKNYSKDYDVIWVNVCNLVNLDYLRLAKKNGINKRIIHSHTSKHKEHNWRDVIHAMNKKIVSKYATDFWACSEDAAKWFYDDSLLEKCEIIHNAIKIDNYAFDAEKRNRLRKELDLENKIVVGTVGRLTDVKNHKFLIEICKLLNNPKYIFIIVGIGELEEQLKRIVKKEKLEDRFIFAGEQHDIKAWLSTFDIFAFPSFYEGLSFSSLEAQANGLPMIVSEGISEEAIVNDNVTRIALSDMRKWLDSVRKLNCITRLKSDEVYNNLQKNGFNIVTETKRLESLI